MNCKICGAPRRLQFSHQVLRKYPCDYFYCMSCGFLQTEEPYWLKEAYSSAIAEADTGLLQRNIHLSKLLSVLLYFVVGQRGKYLDVAGGYGALTRLMRDTGFDFYWTDEHCQNLLALGFEGQIGEAFTAVTAFEVLEHVHDPIAFLSDTLEQSSARSIVFSTEIFEGEPPDPCAWWYYAFNTGQHISFFQRRTLHAIAKKLRLRCYSKSSFHMITDRVLDPRLFRLLAHPRIGHALAWIPRLTMKSKTMSDHLDIMSR